MFISCVLMINIFGKKENMPKNAPFQNGKAGQQTGGGGRQVSR